MENSGRVTASLRTDQGRVRSNNQDFIDWREPAGEEEEAKHGWLYILADGAGGMEAGDVASRFATERTVQHYMESEEADWNQRLFQAMQAANTDLREMGARKNGGRMATTMVAIVIEEDRAHIANVGDSRAYLWREGTLKQVTKDHSLVAKLLDEGAITAEEAVNHPRKNVILYSIGSDRTPKIDLYDVTLRPGERLLVCSDGLTRHVDDDEIETLVGQHPPEEATQTLIDLANERGGEDNISVAVLEYTPPPAEAMPATKVAMRKPEPMPTAPAGEERAAASTVLWTFTLILSLVQTLLIFLVWFFLRV